MTQLTPATEKKQDVIALITSPKMVEQLRAAPPRHVTPEGLARIVLTEIRRTPKLLGCTQQSLLGSIMQSAQLGLEPGVLGQCWIIPYGTEAVFIPGYRGYAQLAWRSVRRQRDKARKSLLAVCGLWSFLTGGLGRFWRA